MRDRLTFLVLLVFVIACITLETLGQVWIEWKRLFWGELAMAIREKFTVSVRRAFSPASR